MSALRLAVIGAGHLGRIHARLLSSIPGVELMGVVDPLPEARERVAAEFGVATFAHHQELADRIDAAVIATTTEHHYPVARELLHRGIHLLIEKPVTTNVAEADELIDLARGRQTVLQVGHVERFNPAWTAVTPYLRRPRYIEAVRSSGYTFRSTDVSVVLDLMIHDLDLVLSIVRSRVADVDAVGVTVFGPHPDMAHAHLRFENGCVASLNAARTSFQAQRAMQIVTDHGYVGVDFGGSIARLVQPSGDVLRKQIDVHGLSLSEREQFRQNLFTEVLPLKEIQVEKRNAILDEQNDFVRCVLDGHSPRVSGQQARDCLAVAERILQSMAEKSDHAMQHALAAHPASRRLPLNWPQDSSRRKAG